MASSWEHWVKHEVKQREFQPTDTQVSFTANATLRVHVRLRRAAEKICDPDYSCKDFYVDVSEAFPELTLYLAGGTTSGRSGERS